MPGKAKTAELDTRDFFKSDSQLQERCESPIKPGDLIVSVNGVPVDCHEVKEIRKDAILKLPDTDAGKMVPVVVIRNEEKITLQVFIEDVLRCWLSGPGKGLPTEKEIEMGKERRNRYWRLLELQEKRDKLPIDSPEKAKLEREIIRLENVDRIEIAHEKGKLPTEEIAFILFDLAQPDKVKAYCNRHNLLFPEGLFPDQGREELEEASKQGPSDPAGEVQGQPGPAGKYDYVFRRKGEKEQWEIIYGGKEIGIFEGDGFALIHCLIRREQETQGPIDGVELYRQVRGVADQEDVSISGDSYAISDSQAMKEYRAKLNDLRENIKEAEENRDLTRVTALKEEEEKLYSEIKSQMKPDGTLRSFHNDRKRIHGKVRGSLRRAIENLVCSQEVHEHFKRAFRPGATNHAYNPPSKIPWVLK